jgi:hypothetical protein
VYYTVTATNLIGTSPIGVVNSVYASIIVTHAPTLTLTKTSNTSVSWNVVTNALKYTMYFSNATKSYKYALQANVTAFDFSSFLPNGAWNVTITVTTGSDNFESQKSNAVIITITNVTTSNLTYATEANVPAEAVNYDIVAWVIVIIAAAAAVGIIAWNRRGKLFGKGQPASRKTPSKKPPSNQPASQRPVLF